MKDINGLSFYLVKNLCGAIDTVSAFCRKIETITVIAIQL